MKDPSLAFDGSAWHLFGTGWTSAGAPPDVFHAASGSADGPYVMGMPSVLHGVSGGGVAAPGVIVENGIFHMFMQTEFEVLGGRIEHLVSADGDAFERTDTSLVPDGAIGEASIYDAQPCLIRGERYLAYAAASRVGRTELHLARSSGGWQGPWVRLGAIVRQSDVPFQSMAGCSGYEWGLEGPQLLELPGEGVMLMGVCFLSGDRKGHRQRAFIATAAQPAGPYRVLGTPFDPRLDGWATGENGHATAAVVGDTILVIYQGRQGAGQRWSLGASRIPVARLES